MCGLRSLCLLNPKDSSFNYFIVWSAGNFKLSQQTSYGCISALTTDAGTISDNSC